MFKHFKHKDINIRLWDDCIEKSPNGLIYALSWYLNIVSPNWEGIIKEEQGKYLAVFPLTVFRKFGITYLKTPHFCYQLGLFSRTKIKEDDIKEVSNILLANYPLISHYSLNIENDFETMKKNFFISQCKTYHLSLKQPYSKIHKNFNKNRKERIKRAYRRGIKVSISENINELVNLFSKNTSFKITGGVSEEQYDLLVKLYKEAINRNLGFLLRAYSEDNKTLSMAFFYKFKNLIIYFFSSTTEEGRKNNGIELILNYVIMNLSNSNFILDFEGSDIQSISEFYERFGSEKFIFQKLHRNELPIVFKIIKGMRQKVYKLLRNSF